jgi:hypothetical protein
MLIADEAEPPVSYNGCFGTMLVFLACSDGLLACGDEVSHDTSLNFGSCQKMFVHPGTVDGRRLYACSGMAMWGPEKASLPATGDPVWARWDSVKEVESYVDALEPELDLNPTQPSMLGPILQKRLVKYLSGIHPGNLPPQRSNKESCLMDAVHYTAISGRIAGEYATLSYDREKGMVSNKSHLLCPLQDPHSRILVMGVTEIYDCLLDGSDQELNKYRSEPILRPLVSEDRLTTTLPTTDDALGAAIRLIQIAASVSLTVGPAKQAMLLTRNGEVKHLGV